MKKVHCSGAHGPQRQNCLKPSNVTLHQNFQRQRPFSSRAFDNKKKAAANLNCLISGKCLSFQDPLSCVLMFSVLYEVLKMRTQSPSTDWFMYALSFSILSLISPGEAFSGCYRSYNDTIEDWPLGSPCADDPSTGPPFLNCCANDEKTDIEGVCMSNNICYIPQYGGTYYLSPCTDPAFDASVCPKHCSKVPLDLPHSYFRLVLVAVDSYSDQGHGG